MASCGTGLVARRGDTNGLRGLQQGKRAHTSLRLKSEVAAWKEGGTSCFHRVQHVLHLVMHLGVKGSRSGVGS